MVGAELATLNHLLVERVRSFYQASQRRKIGSYAQYWS
ncbi:hypothetical protein RintRC_3875 [Richelia intracellularis]|nr:hypothetical protein RintRC_3875 [Richelia intracellularis]